MVHLKTLIRQPRDHPQDKGKLIPGARAAKILTTLTRTIQLRIAKSRVVSRRNKMDRFLVTATTQDFQMKCLISLLPQIQKFNRSSKTIRRLSGCEVPEGKVL